MINLNKINNEAPELIDLSKKTAIILEKRKLAFVTAKVGAMLDFSGSMRQRYKSGEIQRAINRILPLAQSFDDDGEIDFGVFDTEADFLGTVNLKNYHNAVEEYTANRHMGRTNYADAIEKTMDYYEFKPYGLVREPKIVSSSTPVFMIFLTDGSPDSKKKAKDALIESSYMPIFWKFLSVGDESFDFLQNLDDLPNRVVDNADYKHLGNNIDAISDETLIEWLLEEFNDWITDSKLKGILN